MKKISLLLLCIHLLTACTNEIGPIPNNEPRKLIISALLNAGKTENAIYLNLSDYSSPQIVKNGIIRLYINGELSETIDECTWHPENEEYENYKDYYYSVHSHFKTGDHVRIEAETRDGKFNAEAETTVYEPLRIIKMDTLRITINSSFGSEEYTRLKIKLEAPECDQTLYYRIQLKQDYVYHVFNRETQKDSLITDTFWGLRYYYDTALMDGKPGDSANHDSDMEFIPVYENYYQVFSDAYFTNHQYTMTADAYIYFPYWDQQNYEIRKTTCHATLQVYAISPNEYRYLRAASAYNDNNSSSPLESPVIFPNNIKGGIGIFAIENPTEYRFEMKR